MRDFLKTIDLLKITKKISPKLEVMEYLQDGKPVLFENIDGYPDFKIVGNICNSRDVMAKAVNTRKDELVFTISRALDEPRKYKMVESGDFLANEFKNPNIIEHIPLLMHHKLRKRYYATATIALARDPITGRQNASFHRMMYLGKNRFAIRIVPRDLYNFFQENRERGRDTDVVIICGVHPAVALAAATSYPDLNELEFANTLLNGGLKCVDVKGIDVPTNSEVVMEGRILHDQTADEGPFVDATGTWDRTRAQPVVEIEKAYMRDDPIWQVILPAGPEHLLLMGMPQETRILKIVRNAVPSVRRAVLTEGGCCWLHAVVSIKKREEGDGKNAGIAALAAHPSLKRVVVVDDDIDVTDQKSVEWALATRLQPSRGIIIIPEASGSSLDPSVGKTGITSKWIVDATIPLGRDRREFVKVKD